MTERSSGPDQRRPPPSKIFELVVGVLAGAAALAALTLREFVLAVILFAIGVAVLLGFLVWRGQRFRFVGSIAVALALAALAVVVARDRESTGAGRSSASPAASSSAAATSSPPASATPSSAPPASTSPASTSPTSAPSADVVTYLDERAATCGPVAGTGSMTMNGTPYAHAIHQWAGTTTNDFNLARQARRLRATVGVRDDARSEVRVQFELTGDGRRLFRSKVLQVGRTQDVDVSVQGVLRITLRVNAVSAVWGYAGWVDPQVTSEAELPC